MHICVSLGCSTGQAALPEDCCASLLYPCLLSVVLSWLAQSHVPLEPSCSMSVLVGGRIQDPAGVTQPCPDCEQISCSGGETLSGKLPTCPAERSNPVCKVVSGEYTCPLVPNNEHNQM